MKQIGLVSFFLIAFLLITACQNEQVSTASQESKNGAFDFIGETVVDFKAKTYQGEDITNDIFTQKTLTMVNFWSPSCKPCIEELPELDALKMDLEALNVQLITVCVEGKTEDVTELRETFKMDYPIVISGKKDFMQECIKNFEFIPFTIFIDQEGKYHSKVIVGSQTREEYLKQIQEILTGR